MKIGIPSEIKPNEGRVSVTPAGVRELTGRGHKVLVQSGSGEKSGFCDDDYKKAGAKIAAASREVWDNCDMIIKVKEPVQSEYEMIKPGQILYTYLHLAGAGPELTAVLLEKNVTAVAYETVQDGKTFPLLAPMSRVAGCAAITEGSQHLKTRAGIFLGSITGVVPPKVAIIGGGEVGINAAWKAHGLGCDVTILERSAVRLGELDNMFRGTGVKPVASDSENIFRYVTESDLTVSGVYSAGSKAPKIITAKILDNMKRGRGVIDVAIDQGGSVEGFEKSTTHANPVRLTEKGVWVYSVANMPGAFPRTSTLALTNSTLPYALKLADLGPEEAMKQDKTLLKGLNTYKGKLTLRGAAEALGLSFVPPETALGIKKQ